MTVVASNLNISVHQETVSGGKEGGAVEVRQALTEHSFSYWAETENVQVYNKSMSSPVLSEQNN